MVNSAMCISLSNWVICAQYTLLLSHSRFKSSLSSSSQAPHFHNIFFNLLQSSLLQYYYNPASLQRSNLTVWFSICSSFDLPSCRTTCSSSAVFSWSCWQVCLGAVHILRQPNLGVFRSPLTSWSAMVSICLTPLSPLVILHKHLPDPLFPLSSFPNL